MNLCTKQGFYIMKMKKKKDFKKHNNEIINIINDVCDHVEVDNDDINYNNKVNDDLNDCFKDDEIFDKDEMIKTLKLINDEENTQIK